jgi:hypothetical protein
MMAAPTMAAAQSVQPAAETVQGSQLRDDEGGIGTILPIIAIIAIVFLIRELVKDRNIGSNPVSP